MNLKDRLTRLENRPAYKLTADWFFTPEEELTIKSYFIVVNDGIPIPSELQQRLDQLNERLGKPNAIQEIVAELDAAC
ncbi:MAG: hypothetical protein ACXW0O_04775 [Methylosarcina sp.]